MPEQLQRPKNGLRLMGRFAGACAIVGGAYFSAAAMAANSIAESADAEPAQRCQTEYYPWDGNRHQDCHPTDKIDSGPFKAAQRADFEIALVFVAAGSAAIFSCQRKTASEY